MSTIAEILEAKIKASMEKDSCRTCEKSSFSEASGCIALVCTAGVFKNERILYVPYKPCNMYKRDSRKVSERIAAWSQKKHEILSSF